MSLSSCFGEPSEFFIAQYKCMHLDALPCNMKANISSLMRKPNYATILDSSFLSTFLVRNCQQTMLHVWYITVALRNWNLNIMGNFYNLQSWSVSIFTCTQIVPRAIICGRAILVHSNSCVWAGVLLPRDCIFLQLLRSYVCKVIKKAVINQTFQ